MTTYKVNEAAVKQARRLIDEGIVDTETGWGDAAPAAAEGNKEIEREGYDGYGRWHLGIDTEASEETKDKVRPHPRQAACGAERPRQDREGGRRPARPAGRTGALTGGWRGPPRLSRPTVRAPRGG